MDITKQERRDAELDYVKKYAAKWRADKNVFLLEHPRYTDLVKRKLQNLWSSEELEKL